MAHRVLTLSQLVTLAKEPSQPLTQRYPEDYALLGLCTAEHPIKGHLVFIGQNKKLEKLLAFKDVSSHLGALLIDKKLAAELPTQLADQIPIVQSINAKEVFINLLHYFNPYTEEHKNLKALPHSEPSPSSIKAGENLHVGPYSMCGEHVTCGDNVVLMGNNVIGSNVRLGSRVTLHPGVVLYPGTIIGDDVIIHAGTVIGSEGFGYHPTPKGLLKIPQIGHVILGSDIEIGANVTIDRGTLDATKLGDHVRIDNLVQIAHNVTIGAGTIIVAQAGIAGSTTIGRQVILAGQVGIADHVVLGDGAQIGAQGGVIPRQNVPAGAKLVGSPGIPYKEFFRQQVFLRKAILKK